MLRRLTALALALGHAVLLAGTTSLHRHGPGTPGLDLADLPAHYHHHDFRFAPGGEDPTPAHDECIGCRLERTIGLPLPAASAPVDGAVASSPVTAPPDVPPAGKPDDLLPRAPPLT